MLRPLGVGHAAPEAGVRRGAERRGAPAAELRGGAERERARVLRAAPRGVLVPPRAVVRGLEVRARVGAGGRARWGGGARGGARGGVVCVGGVAGAGRSAGADGGGIEDVLMCVAV